MKLSRIVLVGMVLVMSAAVAKADGVADPSIHVVKTPGGDPACPPDPSDPGFPYTCIDPDTNSYLNPVVIDASALVSGSINVSDNFVNSGGASGTTELTTLFLAILYPLGPPPQIFTCSSTIFLNSTMMCPTVGIPNPVCPPLANPSFTCNTPQGEGYLEYYLADGMIDPGEEITATVYEPEPNVLPLLALGLFGVVGLGLRRKRSSAY
jgi:hypothetical protein